MIDNESDYIVEEYIKPNKVRVPLINDERADILGNFVDTKLEKSKQNAETNFDPEENPFSDIEVSDQEDDEKDDEVEEDEDEVEDEEENEDDVDSELADSDNDNGTDTQEENVVENSDSSNEAVNETNENQSDSEPTPEEPVTQNKKPKKSKKTPVEKTVSTENSNKELNDQQIQSLMRGASKQNRYVLYVTNLNYETTRDKLLEFFSTAGTVKSVRIPKTRKTAFAFVEMTDINGFKVIKLNSIQLD